MLTINLSEAMKKVGQLLSEELKGNIRKNVDLDGNAYVPVVETVQAYARGGNIVKKHVRSRKRLVHTGKFNQEAVLYESSPTQVRVYANPASYDDRVSYEDIVRFNDKQSPDLSGAHGNTIRARGPKIFPGISGKKNEVTSMKQWPVAVDVIKKDVEKQVQAEANKKIRVILNIG